jgi:hypothetical protein
MMYKGRRSILTLHTDDSLASVKFGRSLGILQDLFDSRCNKGIQFITEWVAEHGMNDQSLSSEEGLLPDTLGSIDDLIRNYEMSRLNLLT